MHIRHTTPQPNALLKVTVLVLNVTEKAIYVADAFDGIKQGWVAKSLVPQTNFKISDEDFVQIHIPYWLIRKYHFSYKP